jgi:hypothetical protein
MFASEHSRILEVGAYSVRNTEEGCGIKNITGQNDNTVSQKRAEYVCFFAPTPQILRHPIWGGVFLGGHILKSELVYPIIPQETKRQNL